MPAVEGGSLVLEVSEVLSKLHDTRQLEAIVDLAVEGSAVLVTSPSPAVVEGPRGPLVMTLGVGTLIIEQPGVTRILPGGLGVLRLRRREWVDGCRIEGRGDVVIPEGPSETLEGTAVALDFKDPAALLVNGLRARHSLIPVRLGAERILAEVKGRPLLGVIVAGNGRRREYVVHAHVGEAARRLMYIAPLAGGCGRGLR